MRSAPCATESRSKTLLGRAKTLRPPPTDADPFATVAVMDLARPVRERVRVRADSKNVDVIFYCTCGCVWVQPHIFREALYELLDNAIRANRDGHPVIVDVRNTREGDALWQVQDAGGGMSAQTLATLGFPVTVEVGQEHAGLGVARAWAIIETHDGLLSFESELGVGTTATIWLPKRLGPANTGHEEPESEA